MLLQVLVLNNVNIDGFVNPYVFVLFILMLSFDTKPLKLLLLGFLLGLIIDLFNGTLGMNAFATVVVAFLRPHFLNTFKPRSDKIRYPSVKTFEFSWMLFYITSLIFIHHVVYFLIENGSFVNIFHTLVLIILSTIISSFIAFLLLFTFNSEK